MINLVTIKNSNVELRSMMPKHYSQPKGFVGRNICYLIRHDWTTYGAIVGGSSPMHLSARDKVIPLSVNLNSIVGNIFYHVEKQNGAYPCRNFTVKTLSLFRAAMVRDWKEKYGDEVLAFETLVELPRTGEVYKRDGWIECGTTKGYTCKREPGEGTDSYSGKRVWDRINLRPKLVFCRMVK